jgi:hypothetical protein
MNSENRKPEYEETPSQNISKIFFASLLLGVLGAIAVMVIWLLVNAVLKGNLCIGPFCNSIQYSPADISPELILLFFAFAYFFIVVVLALAGRMSNKIKKSTWLFKYSFGVGGVFMIFFVLAVKLFLKI